MKTQLINQICITFAAVAMLVGVNTYSNATSTPSTPTVAPVRYATLTLTEEGNSDGNMVFVTYFNFGNQELIGKSKTSREASYRNLIARLGSTPALSNIYTLMDAIGNQGWELVETNYEESRIVRVFIQR